MGATASQHPTLGSSAAYSECSKSSDATTTSANTGSLFFTSPDPGINSIGLIFSKDRKLKKLKQKIRTKWKKSGSANHSAVFRNFAESLATAELAQLYEEYRGLFFMKELALHAESARPMASTIRNDLAELYDLKHHSDVTLVYKGVEFPVHKPIVCVRCPYFRELLGKKPHGSRVPVNLDIGGLRVELFNDLLKYLYSGELAGSYDPRSNSASYEALIRISQQCGVPNPLRHDLKHLLETGIYSDASLCFQTTADDSPTAAAATAEHCTCFEQQVEFSCHQAILSARSPFFRNVITRQQKRNSAANPKSVQQRMKIVLDESIIPRRLARVLLNVMYRDSENLLEMVQASICKCQKSSSSNSIADLVRELTDLYEIARFLEIDILVQSCEDILINYLNHDTLISLLKWSEQPHGSPWIKRQALTYLKEEFSAIIASSNLLYQLDYGHLWNALRSDYLEASELDALRAVVKWWENRLSRQLEEREPNLLLSHSLTRKSIRKKDVDDAKLRDAISELVSLIRLGHLLPLDAEFITTSVKRGLIELPGYMANISTQRLAWFRNSPAGNGNHFVKPRFFTSYFEECKAILEERLDRPISLEENLADNLFSAAAGQTQLAVIPDNLYMIDRLNSAASMISDGADLAQAFHNQLNVCLTASSSSSSAIGCYEELDDNNRKVPNLPVLEERILFMMRQREQELRTAPFCVRALHVAHSSCEALRLIQLRVVREFGLPDVATEILHLRHPQKQLPQQQQHHHRPRRRRPPPPVEEEDHLESICDRTAADQDQDILMMPPPPPRPKMLMSGVSHESHGFIHGDSQGSASSTCDDPFSYDIEMKLDPEQSLRYEVETQFSSTESQRTRYTSSSLCLPDIAFVGKEV